MKSRLLNKLNRFVIKSHWYNEEAFKDCRKFWELNEKDIEVINLGSSSGVYDFEYSDLNIKGANWAVAPQSMYGDFAILKQYKSHLKQGATIIYPLCPFTSISGAEEYVEDRCYTFLNYDLIPNAHYIRLTKVMQMKNNPVLYYPLVSLKTDIKRALRPIKKTKHTMTEQQLQKDATVIMNSWKKQFNLDDLSLPLNGNNKIIYDRGVALLHEIVRYCSENGFRLIIVIPPMHKSLASMFSPSDRENLIDGFIRSGIDSSTEYYNMMYDESYSNDTTLFRNSYFLNEKGASLYTADLIKKVNLQ